MGVMNTINPVDVPASKLVLRQMAEKLVNGDERLSEATLAAMPPTLVLKMLHDLQVHEIELEMQNETLRQTQLQLVAMQARYFDLYDLAPISYCTVNETGIILEANLATAELLGEARTNLVGQRISHYIGKEFQDTYYLCRKLLLSTGARQSCELHMLKVDGTTFWVKASLTSAKASDGDILQRMVLSDITDAKVMAMAMRESEERLRATLDTMLNQ
jgi:PAS domain S-box-containing protein